MALTPPVPTTLPTKVASKATTDAYNTAQAAALLGGIADQIIAASHGGMYYVIVEDFRITSSVSTALTTAGYTVASASGGKVQISWS